MNETAALATVAGTLWGLVLALVGVIWATLKERIRTGEGAIAALVAQNTGQETEIARLKERTIAREEAHLQHREDTATQFSRIEAAMTNGFAEVGRKLDRLSGQGTPYPRPGQYRSTESGERK